MWSFFRGAPEAERKVADPEAASRDEWFACSGMLNPSAFSAVVSCACTAMGEVPDDDDAPIEAQAQLRARSRSSLRSQSVPPQAYYAEAPSSGAMTFEQGTQRTFYDAARETRKAEVKKSESVFMNEFITMLKSGVSVRQRTGNEEEAVKIRLVQPASAKGAPQKQLIIEWLLEATEAQLGAIALGDIVVILAAADEKELGGYHDSYKSFKIQPRKGNAVVFHCDDADINSLLVDGLGMLVKDNKSRRRLRDTSNA
ncbi:hypothetical protein M885DRAFT_522157 [Pelagophyceae sp. CCMP2097]|nr:hypothetical protein M885DRAFT_522157 [Pelagophyceae sp. CCMP2097]